MKDSHLDKQLIRVGLFSIQVRRCRFNFSCLVVYHKIPQAFAARWQQPVSDLTIRLLRVVRVAGDHARHNTPCMKDN